LKLCTRDYVGEVTRHANFAFNWPPLCVVNIHGERIGHEVDFWVGYILPLNGAEFEVLIFVPSHKAAQLLKRIRLLLIITGY